MLMFLIVNILLKYKCFYLCLISYKLYGTTKYFNLCLICNEIVKKTSGRLKGIGRGKGKRRGQVTGRVIVKGRGEVR